MLFFQNNGCHPLSFKSAHACPSPNSHFMLSCLSFHKLSTQDCQIVVAKFQTVNLQLPLIQLSSFLSLPKLSIHSYYSRNYHLILVILLQNVNCTYSSSNIPCFYEVAMETNIYLVSSKFVWRGISYCLRKGSNFPGSNRR